MSALQCRLSSQSLADAVAAIPLNANVNAEKPKSEYYSEKAWLTIYDAPYGRPEMAVHWNDKKPEPPTGYSFTHTIELTDPTHIQMAKDGRFVKLASMMQASLDAQAAPAPVPEPAPAPAP